MADPTLMNVYRLADRLHKLPSEVLDEDPEQLTYFMAYTRIAAREDEHR